MSFFHCCFYRKFQNTFIDIVSIIDLGFALKLFSIEKKINFQGLLIRTNNNQFIRTQEKRIFMNHEKHRFHPVQHNYHLF